MSKLSLTGFDANNKNIVNVADPSAATDATNKQYVDALVRGLSWKDEVKAATTTNGTLATAFANGQTIDGVTLATNDRILLKDQSSAGENGIFIVQASGAPVRATDADSTAELENAAVFVAQGTVNADKAFVQTSTITTPGTTAQVWSQFGGGTAVTGGAGLVLTGSTLDVGAGTGIIVNANDVQADTAVLTRKYSADCAATTNPQTFTHSLGSKDVVVVIRRVSDDVIVDADVTATSTSAISVNFGGAPSAAQYRVTVHV